MSTTSQERDIFPLLLASPVVAALAGAVALACKGHPIWAIVTGIAGGVVGIPFFGWLVSGSYLEADMVVTVKRHGGSMTREELSAFAVPGHEGVLRRLEERGVLSIQDGMVRLNEGDFGVRLALFIRVAEGLRGHTSSS